MKEEHEKGKKENLSNLDKGQMKQEIHLVRILAKDIPGNQTVYSGLTLIKGIKWGLSNAVCKNLGIDRKKKVKELSKEEISKIENFIADGHFSGFLLNRRKDLDSGKDKHLVGSDLNLQNDFDVKRLKKIKCYKGSRHALGLPVRGQRTKSNFRKNRKKSGVVGVKKAAPAPSKKGGGEKKNK